MADLIIKDGTGTGNRAKVDNDNRIHVKSNSGTDMEFASHEKQTAYSFSALEKTITSAGGESHILWIKNVNPEKTFQINSIFISYNGGNTNHNRIIIGRGRIGSSTPSANNTSFTGSNLNLTSANVALVEAYVWNGTGTGMTIAVNGPTALSGYFAQGFNSINFEGALIIGYNQVLDFTIQAEEDGLASVVVTGWFENFI